MNRKNKGFTLVEMLVTLVILSILLSVSVFGLVEWQEYARFNQQNEYAQILFVAAQNQLTEYSRNGSMEKFQKEITSAEGGYYRTLDIAKLTNGQGVAYDKDEVWYESVGKGSDAFKYQGALCYVSCVAGDYERYKEGALSSAGRSRGADVVFELLSNYVYDESILNNSISIEFSPEEGQIFAVCFSDREAEFVYLDPSATAGSGSVNIANREENYRRSHMIGYYGADTLARATSAGGQKPVLAEVKLNNEETLNLSFKVQMKYNLNVYDKDSKQLALSITLDGSMIHNYDARSTVSGAVTRYTYDADGTQNTQVLDDYDILAWIESDETVRIVLDAVDIQATSSQYIQDLKAATGLKSDKAAETVFASTYSFHRFGLDADNIYCTIQGTSDHYKPTAMKQSNAEAAYFATAQIEEDGGVSLSSYSYTYKLANARHLYNVRFVEDLSAEEENAYSDAIDSDSITHRFEVSQDIDWDGFAAAGNLYYTKTGMLDLSQVSTADIMQITGVDGSDCARVVTQCDFPSIKQLRYGDTFAGNSQNGLTANNKEIANLSIVETSNVLYGIYNTATGSLTEERPVGLFIHNYGTITKLNLDSITVEGNKKIGAFCGINRGNLTRLEVKSSDESKPSTVSGQENVGGIMGYQESLNDAGINDGTAQSPELSDLTNRAKITGKLYVGGIVGEIHVPAGSTEPAISIEECENYGAIVARNSEALTGLTTTEAKTEPRYLGGIVGYCNNEYTDESGNRDPERLMIVKCTSSPEYSETDLDLFLERNRNDSDDGIGQITDKDYQGTNLRGVYVGGIVGYNNYATITNCSTESERDKTGYIFGYQYVGGIVGFNQGPASGIEGGQISINTKGVNEINVIGYQYVGGISGCNADILYQDGTTEADLDEYQVIQPDSTTNLMVKVSNWENRGIIYAKDSYAGGITGYNAGWIYDCDTRVQNNNVSGFFQETYSGDYAGGITGYNNGIVGKTERTVSADGRSSTVKKAYTGSETTICYVTGNNYVGGIVGYNDVDAVVEDYGIAGGRIKGNGSFVGGYAGLNASLQLLMDDDKQAHNIVSKPNEVSGKYFVGGSIGGNLVDCGAYASSEDVVINTRFETNNFFGKITSEAFAGGFVGYNLLLADTSSEEIDALQQALLEEFDKIDEGSGKYADYVPAILPSDMSTQDVSEQVLCMMEKVEVLDHIDTRIRPTIKRSKGRMVISGNEDSRTQNRLGGIYGAVYLGGVIGYNDEATALEIRYVSNTTPIQASMAIPNADEQVNRTKEYDGETHFTYSYAGGIIGKVAENVLLYQCENSDGASVKSDGTYTGGLAEINEGVIEECVVSSVGTASTDYIGGICGLNKTDGLIKACVLKDETVTGRNYVGGIVAENFGTVQDSDIQNEKNDNLVNTTVYAVGISVTTEGEYRILDKIEEKQGIVGCVAAYNAGTISQSTDLLDIKVVSGGNYAGGLVGVNEGNVINAKENGKIVITGSVGGQEYVGGVIGVNKGRTTTASSGNQVSGYRNEALVTAENGNAGGILGNNAGHSNIVDCENAGEVIARQKGNAGGITAENSANILNCIDYGVVSAPNGDCGGITAWNYQSGNIQDCQVISPDDEMLEFMAKETVGGITSHNQGTIKDPGLIRVSVHNYTNSDASNIGIIAGENYDTGMIILGEGDAVDACTASSYSDNSNIGGVAGLNLGTISAPAWYDTTVQLPEGEEDLTTRTFDKPKAWVKCTIGYMNDAVSFGDLGGIAGKNEGIIENIGVKSTVVTGKLGSTATGTGGVAGVSIPAGENETAVTDSPRIQNCTFDGTVSAEGTYANMIYLGGIVGLNQEGSTIYGCRIGVEEKTLIDAGDSQESANFGYVGGIAGNTYGDIIACDSYHTDGTEVEVLVQTNTGMVGGIVGLQQAGAQVTGEQNRRLSTGKQWTVSYYQYQNDQAIGGIVGTSYSNKAYEYISNYATALYQGSESSSTHFNMARAGIVGRIEATSTQSIPFSYCYNYGDILGKSADGSKYNTQGRCGGIIGQLQYAGATLKSCKNYGIMRGGHYTGGMIGCVYSASTDIEIINCENHGNLYGASAAAGMIANRYHGNGDACDFIFYHCVNTGLVGSSRNNTSRSGMGTVMAGNGGNAVTGYYNQCQNYGMGTVDNQFSGIQNGIKAVNIQNCFDMSGGTFSALASVTNQSGNYYINRTSFTSMGTETGNSASKRLNYKDGALYDGAAITSVQDLTTLTNGTAGSNAYYNDRTQSYVIGASDSEQNIRYRTYLEMHVAIEDYIQSGYCVTNIADKTQLDMPENITLNYRTNAGYCTLTWDSVEQAYSYEIQYTIQKNDGTQIDRTEEVVGLCRLHIEADEMADAANLYVQIRAKDGCGQEEHYSDWTTFSTKPREILPAPKYHFEVLYSSNSSTQCNNGKMIAVLDNPEDYIKDGKKIADVVITGSSMSTWRIDPLVGYSETAQTPSKGQRQLRAYAVPTDTQNYAQSPKVASVSYIAGVDIMNKEYNTVYLTGKDTSDSGAKEAGFYGDTTGNLSYYMTVGKANYDTGVFACYYREEVMAYDEEVGAMISYAHGETQRDMMGNASLTLSGFPTDLTSKEKIVVQNIYWAAQRYSTYYGHTVGNNLTLEQLKSLVDTAFYSVSGSKVSKAECSIWQADGSLQDGYIIYKEKDGTYSVYYSALEAGKQKLERTKGSAVHTVGGLKEEVYTRASGTGQDDAEYYIDSNGSKIEIQPEPIIADLTQDADGYYVFTWDVGQDEDDYKNAVYSIEIIGTTVDNKEVSLATVDGTKDTSINWKKGAGSAAGCATYRIQPQSNWNYKSLTIEVSRHGAVDAANKTQTFPAGAIKTFPIKIALTQISVPGMVHDRDRDGLLYQITWSGVTTATEQEDLGGYLITVTGEQTAAHYYYVLEKAGDALPDTIQQLKQQVDAGNITDVTGNCKKTNKSDLETVIDLKDFKSGETVEVSIKALAKQNAAIYKDGPEGITVSQKVPERLQAPDVSKVSTNLGSADQTLLVSQFDASGIIIQYTDTAGDGTQGLRLAVAVYDTLPDDADTSKNAVDNASETWNLGASETLVAKTDKQNMSGTQKSAAYSLALGTGKTWSDYAGKYLKIALQGTSESAVSSFWSDEDAKDESTNYIWLQLPKAQLDELGLQDSTGINWAENNSNQWEKVTAADHYVTTRTLTFAAVNQAEGYRIQIVGNDQSVHWIYLMKNGDNYDISYAATDADISGAFANMTSLENVYTTSVGQIAPNGNPETIPYENGTLTDDQAILYATISLDAKGEFFTLSLPDISSAYNMNFATNAQTSVTGQVLVQAVVYDRTDADGNVIENRYINSKADNWTVNPDGSSRIETLEQIQDAPTVEASFTAAEVGEDYQFAVSNPALVAQMLVTDSNGNLLKIDYLDIQTDQTHQISYFIIPKSDFNNGNQICIRLAAITGQNVSAWTGTYILAQNGTLTAVPETAINAAALEVSAARLEWQLQLEAIPEPEQDGSELQQEDDAAQPEPENGEAEDIEDIEDLEESEEEDENTAEDTAGTEETVNNE
jgi:prepilin-type N-terminal cleavage/methylation domain-containing protein